MGSRPPIQDEEVAWAPTQIWGDIGPVALGREPEEAVAIERSPQQNIEREVEIREPQVQVRGSSQEEPGGLTSWNTNRDTPSDRRRIRRRRGAWPGGRYDDYGN